MALALTEGLVYSLSTAAPGIIGARLENAKLEAIATYTIARKFENIDLIYRQIYPLLPAGTIDDVKACSYYIFSTPSKSNVVLADQWIVPGSVELVDGISFSLNFRNASIDDLTRIQKVISSMGYNFTHAITSN